MMKKRWMILSVLALLLTGCAAEETFETVADENVAQVIAGQRQIYVELPGEAASPAVESGSARLYLCDGYDIHVQILESGDLSETVRTLTGYEKDALTVMQTQREGLACYEFAWVSAGETGDLVGRAMVLDDGSYHYCLTVLGDAETAEQKQVFWEDMFASFRLS